MSGPLKGVRVLDLTGVVSGPFATMFLADQGADVLKIEPIGGDITRRSRATIDKAGEFSALFISSNRGKRSLSIDIKSEIGREVLAKLVAQADVLVQNFRPGTMERLAFGEFDNKVSQRAQAFLDACKASDVKADIPPDISLELWQKFVVIVTMSSITAAMRTTIGTISSGSRRPSGTATRRSASDPPEDSSMTKNGSRPVAGAAGSTSKIATSAG